jgi:hypothetical protein
VVETDTGASPSRPGTTGDALCLPRVVFEECTRGLPMDALAEAKTLAKLINGFGVFASQLLVNNRPDLYDRAKNNLNKYRVENDAELKVLDQIAENNQSEKPFKLIEDIFRYTRQDAAGCLMLAHRCLLACAFLGHLLATAEPVANPKEIVRHRETVLH